MKCPNCGRLDFDNSEVCPRCGEPLPPGSGEHSSGSYENAVVDKKSGGSAEESPGPLFTQKKPKASKETKKRREKSVEKDEDISVDELPPERPEPPVSKVEKEIAELGKVDTEEKSADKTEPKPAKATEVAPEAYEHEMPAKPKRLSQPVKEYPSEDFVEKARSITPPPSAKSGIHESGRITSPEPYLKDSATFSSELSTDWIEKYARSHVVRTSNVAGFGMRIWGFVIDWLLLLAMGVVILLAGRLLIVLLDGRQYPPMEQLRILALPVGCIWLVIVFLYFTFFNTASGQTPGKLAMDLRVSTTEGYPPTLGKAALRSLVYMLGMIPLGAGSWWALTNQERRSLHDIAAGTVVLSVIRRE